MLLGDTILKKYCDLLVCDNTSDPMKYAKVPEFIKIIYLIFKLYRKKISAIKYCKYQNSITKNKYDSLISCYTISWWPQLICNNGEVGANDFIFKDVINELKQRKISIIGNDIFTLPLNELYKRNLKLRTSKIKWNLFELSFNLKDVFLSFVVALSYFNNQTCKIKKNRLNLKTTLFEKILLLKIAESIIDKYEPKIVIMTCEYCYFHRELSFVCHEKRIPVIALQHGIITPTHYGYIFDKEEKGKITLPDKTCVFGQYHYDLLTKNSIYEPDQVVVTGQPRYDVLFYADKIYSKERFFTEYKINPAHKIVLWTTQCHSLSEEENNKNFKAVFKTMQNLKDTTLIIKQHPGEREEDTKMIEEFLSKYEISAVVTPKSSDTYEQLFVCDLMITRHSTTAMEAVALNKPVVILNLSGEPDIVEYVQDGVALGVYKEENLKLSIEKLLKDDSELAKSRAKYIEKYLYKIDGKATERVVKLIEEMIEELRRKKNEK